MSCKIRGNSLFSGQNYAAKIKNRSQVDFFLGMTIHNFNNVTTITLQYYMG